jgi:hypothetical protein
VADALVGDAFRPFDFVASESGAGTREFLPFPNLEG